MENYAKCNRQANRKYKNMSKSVLLDTKKGFKRMIKDVKKNPTLSPKVKKLVIDNYNEIIKRLVY